MSDAHDLHVLHDLIAAVRATEGAPLQAVDQLDAECRRLGESASDGGGLAAGQTARELGGFFGGSHGGATSDLEPGGRAQRLAALMARLETAMADEGLSGPARDAVIRAFDPIKTARDSALQDSPD